MATSWTTMPRRRIEDQMSELGVIGSGNIGATIARVAAYPLSSPTRGDQKESG